MSEYDQIRQNRRQRGKEARERVLSGRSGQSTRQSSSSEYDFIRNRTIEPVAPPTTEPAPASRTTMNLPVMDVRTSTLARQAAAVEPPKPLPGRDIPVVGPILRGLDWIASNPVSEAIAEYTVPDAPILKNGEYVPGSNARAEFLQRSGQAPATGVSKVIGQIAAPFAVPGAGLGAGTGLYRAGGEALDTVAPRLGQTLGGRVGREAALGVSTGVPLAAGVELSQGSNDLSQAGVQAAIGGALGGAIGAATPLVGRGIQAARNSSSLRSSVNDFSKRVNADRPTVSTSEGPSYDGLNLTSRADEAPSAPEMKQSWFTNLFGNYGVGISPFGSSKRIGSKPLSTEDVIVKRGIRNDSEGLKAEITARARSAYQNYVDALSPLKRVNQTTYETAIDAARANNIANNIIGKDFVTPEGVRLGDGLETVFSKVGRGQDKQFIDYLILRDAETRVARGERVYDESLGMTPEKIRKRIEMYNKRHPGFAAIAKDWDNFTKNLREVYGVKEGLITPEQNAAMEASRPFYTPMRRQFSRSEKPGRTWLQNSSGSSFSGQKAPIKSVSPTGSVRNIIDPRKTMIEAVGAWTNAAMRNRAMQEIVKAIRQNPESMRGVAEIVPETAEATQKSLKEINDVIASDGMEGLLERMNSEFDVLFKKGAQKGGEDNIVRAMVDGQPVKIRVHDPEIVKALTAMSPQQAGLVVDLLTAFSNATKRGATGALAPLFAARSITTDLVQSLIQAKNPARHGVDLVHAIISSVGDKLNIPGLGDLAREFRLAGGEYSAALRGERQLNKSLGRLKRDPILSPQNLGRQALRWNPISATFRLGEAISDVSENINRIAAYKGEMRRLGGVRTPENVRKAITEGREITTNFSRKGAYARELEAVFPYQNAAVQGTYRVMRGFKNNPVKTTAAVAAVAVLPKLFEYAQFHDDPDYQKLPARERMRHLIVSKNDDGTFIKIPIEPAYNSFGELTIEALRHFKDNDPQAFKGTIDALANAWTPPLITGALQGATQGTGIEGSIGGILNSVSPAPILGTTFNKSFTGAPIVPQRLEGRSPQYQYDERTSSLAKQIGEWTGFSPMKVDYLIKAYGGDPARLLLPLTSDVGAGTTRNTLLKNFIVDPVFTNTLADDFYTGKEKLSQARKDFADVDAKLPDWYDEELYKFVNSQAKGSPSKILSDLNARKREISGNRGLSAEQKAQQLRDIQAQINEIYLEVNSLLDAAGVPMTGR
ncbi:hypothetical protein PN4B1_17130 [Paenibacillus naphthalenovorans]|uniref:LPD38 domain-containing protein n=1 Tax=Paenibacillus naphthalenovorans TaxID=162209 RepID=UPI0010B13D01|nr:LPD38 domain-containing protein [Paenibacillus naphthalenovorans]GCL71808.1 hypothetical protein PN4B1_17130 [Paenibacillus naphthalenovorans]